MIYDHWCTDLLLQLRGLQLNRKQLFNAAHWNFSEPGSSHAAYAIKIYWMKSETNGHTGHKNNPTQSKASLHSIYIFIFIWVNYNSSLTWIKAIWGWFPLLTMIIVRSQWGRYNLPRFIIIIRYTYINKYIYMYINIYIYIHFFFGPEVLVAPGDLCRLPSKPGLDGDAWSIGIPVMGWHPEFSPRLRSYKSYGCREETAQTMIS